MKVSENRNGHCAETKNNGWHYPPFVKVHFGKVFIWSKFYYLRWPHYLFILLREKMFVIFIRLYSFHFLSINSALEGFNLLDHREHVLAFIISAWGTFCRRRCVVATNIPKTPTRSNLIPYYDTNFFEHRHICNCWTLLGPL